MESVFDQYLKKGLGKKRKMPTESDLLKHTAGPVITISREYGCSGGTVGHLLVEAINKRNQDSHRPAEWQFISKEIFDTAARQFNVSPEFLSEASFKDSNDLVSNLTTFFSQKYYASSTRVKNAIAKCIHDFAVEGNVVIVGRAAEAITKDIQRAIHVKLVAPLDYRAEHISQRDNITVKEARKACKEQDAKRLKFRQYFEGDTDDLEYFDLKLNASKMTSEEIVETILILAETRGFC